MSQNIRVNNGTQLTVDTDYSNIFVLNNEFNQETLTNTTGAPVTFPAGTVLGRVSATGKLVPFTSAASDGSQHPMGVLNATTTVAATSDANCYNCVGGGVEPTKLVFQGSDTLETVISGKRVKDILVANTAIKLIPSTELTRFNN